jgi:shikimate kinase
MNLVLIGYRGTGKSVVGAIIAERLGMKCVSMDAKIVEKAGMPIPAFVEKYDWPAFRDLESEVARELSCVDNIVIDSGGGVIERPENIDALNANGIIVWLKASVDVIVSRIEGDTERPSLTGAKSFTDEVAEVLDRRTPMYTAAAQHEIDTDHLTPDQVADRVVEIWRSDNEGPTSAAWDPFDIVRSQRVVHGFPRRPLSCRPLRSAPKKARQPLAFSPLVSTLPAAIAPRSPILRMGHRGKKNS